MNKKEFTNELRELSQCMTKEQIERAIMALNGCREKIFRKASQDKEDLSGLLVTIDRNEAEFSFIMAGAPVNTVPGKVKVLGASLLTSGDFELFGCNLPDTYYLWWLYDRKLVWGKKPANQNDNQYAFIRPVLIISDAGTSGLKAKDEFYINTEKFRMISDSIAIKTACLQDSCSFTAQNYESSMIKCCVEGWYVQLMRSNKLWEEENASQTVHNDSYNTVQKQGEQMRMSV